MVLALCFLLKCKKSIPQNGDESPAAECSGQNTAFEELTQVLPCDSSAWGWALAEKGLN